MEETKSVDDEFADRIFVKGHFTAYEELLFAKNEISELRIETGKLNSEVDHLNEVIRQLKQDALLTKEENKKIRESKLISDLITNNKKLKKENNRLRNEIADSAAKIYKMNNQK